MIIGEIIANLGISQLYGFLLLFSNLLLIAFFSYNRIQLSRLQKQIVFLFFICIIYLIILELSIDYTVGITTAIKHFMVALLIVVIINDKRFSIRRLTNFFTLVAFILSLLSILQYIGYLINSYDMELYTYNTYSPGEIVLMGFGGFADTYSWGYYYRNQSFFIEPARFAQFLMIPLFLSINKLIHTRTRNNYAVFIIIFVAFILTFSVGNYFSLLFGILIIALFGKEQFIKQRFKIFYKAIIYGMSIIIIYSGIQLFQYTDQTAYFKQSGSVLGKNTTASVINRLYRFNLAISEVDENFFGNPGFRKQYIRNTTALGDILIIAGIPMAFLCLSYSGYFYLSIIKLIRRSKNKLVYAGSIAYFIPFNWYGSYYEILFLFQLLLLTSITKIEKLKVTHI